MTNFLDIVVNSSIYIYAPTVHIVCITFVSSAHRGVQSVWYLNELSWKGAIHFQDDPDNLILQSVVLTFTNYKGKQFYHMLV